MRRAWNRWLIAALVALTALPANAANDTDVPSATDIMFERPHLKGMAKGSEATYRFQRIVSDPNVLGLAFEDDVNLKIEDVADDGTSTANLVVFTGERSRGDNSNAGMTGNPLLVFFLDRAVQNYAMLSGGNRAYLKNAFRVDMRQNAKVEPVKVTYDGQSVDGYRVKLVPYAKDLNRQKMKGYESSHFEVVLSEKVPGHFVRFVSVWESTEKGSPRLEERITLEKSGVE